MKLLNDGNLLIFRYPGTFSLASAVLLLLPLGFGLFGLWGIYQANSEWDDVLLIPLGICAALILASGYGAFRLWRQRRLPRPTRALIFDNAAKRLTLSPAPWSGRLSADLETLPSYGYEQFTGWRIRSWTVSAPGNDRMNRSTYYAVSLIKTDGGYFDVFETGWEPSADAVLNELSSQIPVGGQSSVRAASLPLPASIHHEPSISLTRYWWNTNWSWAGTLSALMYLSLVAGGFYLVIASAPGEEGDAFRAGLVGLAAAVMVILAGVGIVRWRKAQRTVQCLQIRPGVLEYGTAPRSDPGREGFRATQVLDLGGTLHVRYDRAANTRTVPALWLCHEDGSSLMLELSGLSDGELVVLEQSLEADIRRHGGVSE